MSFVLQIWFKQDKKLAEAHIEDLTRIDTVTSSLVLAMCLSAYIIVALYSVIFSIRRLNRPGVSKEVRKLFSRKHTFYVMLFIVIWTLQLMSSYYHLFNPWSIIKDDITNKHEQVDLISGVANFSTGIFLALVRLFEPFFLFLMKKIVLMCFGIILDEDEDGIKTQTLSTFLASSLNVELVHIILKGVKKFSNMRIEEENYEASYDISTEEARELRM